MFTTLEEQTRLRWSSNFFICSKILLLFFITQNLEKNFLWTYFWDFLWQLILNGFKLNHFSLEKQNICRAHFILTVRLIFLNYMYIQYYPCSVYWSFTDGNINNRRRRWRDMTLKIKINFCVRCFLQSVNKYCDTHSAFYSY